MYRPGRKVIGALVGTLLFASACGSGGENEAGGGGGGGDNGTTLIYAVPAVASSIDMAFWQGDATRWTVSEMGSTLVEYDLSNVPGAGCEELPDVDDLRGGVAESWEVSDDGKHITFTLRDDAVSSFGNPLTSADVEWSILRAFEVGQLVPLLSTIVTHYDADDPVTVVDDRTVTLNLLDATHVDLAVLTMLHYGILDSTEAKEHATDDDPWAEEWLSRNSANFGPWQVTAANFDPDTEVIYEPNENYHGERGNVERLIIRAVPESSTRSQLLRAGEIDVAGDLTYEELAALEGQSGIVVEPCVSADQDVLALQIEDERFSDPRVRKAISLAIDRDDIVEGPYRGYALPAVSGIHQNFDTTRPDDALHQDLDEARSLLAEAGYENGFSATLTLSPTRPGPHAERLGVLVQSQLSQIGINVDIELVAGAADFVQRHTDGAFEMILYNVPPVVGDPYYSLVIYNESEGVLNNHNYESSLYDELVERNGLLSTPADERQALFTEIDDLMMEDVPLVYLADVQFVNAYRDGVTGFQRWPDGELRGVHLSK